MTATLPDLVRVGLDVLFVNINPSVYSVERGHYFARRSNKFWPCVSRSVLTLAAREALGLARLEPEHDVLLPRFGIGFTDLVKRATARANDVAPSEFAAAVHALLAKVAHYRPRVACFHGMTAFRPVHRALAPDAAPALLGAQSLRLGTTRLFVVPNPSGANAHSTREEQTAWYDALAAFARKQEGLP
ncbi:MAG TPA: mismatch-specific DNA-glycosylase [Candidatus Limnocylindria bacterium]|nr:mismatch-specific DNA-glycosylase [Candidatus Limnocylindria bacterium]